MFAEDADKRKCVGTLLFNAKFYEKSTCKICECPSVKRKHAVSKRWSGVLLLPGSGRVGRVSRYIRA